MKYVGVHGKGCCGPCFQNHFGVTYCSWCGQVIAETDQDLSPALEESIRRVQARKDARPCSICRQTHGSEIVHECE